MANKEKQIALKSSAIEFIISSNEAQESSLPVAKMEAASLDSQKDM